MLTKKKLIRITAALTLIIIALSIILSKIIFNSDRLTAIVIPRISQLLNRQVSAESVELSFLPTLGIRITGLRVSNPEEGKFSSPYLIDSKSIVIDARILPLLKNRLEINNVIFYSPRIYLEKNLNDQWNTDKLFSETYYNKNTTTRGSLSSLLLSNFEIDNGTINYISGRRALIFSASNINLKSRIKTVVTENKLVSETNLSVGQFELQVAGTTISFPNPLKLTAGFNYDRRHDLLTATTEDAKLFGVSFQAHIHASYFPQNRFTLDVENIDSSAMTLWDILPDFLRTSSKQESFKGNVTFGLKYNRSGFSQSLSLISTLKNVSLKLNSGDSLSAKLVSLRYYTDRDSSYLRTNVDSARLGLNNFTLSFSMSPPYSVTAFASANIDFHELGKSFDLLKRNNFEGSMRLRYALRYDSRRGESMSSGLLSLGNVLAEVPVGIDTLYKAEIDGAITFTNSTATFNKLLIKLGGTDAVLSGSAYNYIAILLGKRAVAPSFNIDIVSKTFNTIGIIPHMNLNPGKLFLAWFPAGSTALKLNLGTLILTNDTLKNVSASMNIENYFVKIRNLRYSSRTGNYSYTGWVDYSQDKRTTFSLKSLIFTGDFGKLFSKFLGRNEILGGQAKLFLNLNGVYLDSGLVDLATLGGSGKLQLSSATIRKYSVLTRLYNFLGADSADSLRINTAAVSFDLNDGRVYFNKFVLNGRPAEITLDGWHGFDGTLDYKIKMKMYPPLAFLVAKKMSATYSNSIPGKNGELLINLVVGGTTTDSRFTITSVHSSGDTPSRKPVLFKFPFQP
ncbi:MAG: AsmA-like C-terminal region-containing protein [Candidatus Kryptoniota bacterium]